MKPVYASTVVPDEGIQHRHNRLELSPPHLEGANALLKVRPPVPHDSLETLPNIAVQ